MRIDDLIRLCRICRAELILAVLVPALSAGCMFQTNGGGVRIPLRIIPELPPSQVVAVSLVTSTEPLNYFVWYACPAHKVPTPMPRCDWGLSLEEVRLLDVSKPTLFSPKWTQAMIFFVYQSRYNGYALFAPGYEPAVFTAELQRGGGLAWEPDTSPSGSDETYTMEWRVRADPLPPIFRQQPAAGGPPASLLYLLGWRPFWDALRSRHFWGQNRIEIEIVCRTVAQTAGAYDALNPGHTWTPEEARALDWCRQVGAAALSRQRP